MSLRKLAGLTCLLALTATVSAKAMMIAPPPGIQRVAMADCVIVGKVTSLEGKTVKAARFPGDKDKADFVIATVKIETGLIGTGDMTSIRVGFVPPVDPIRPGPGPIRPPIRRLPPIKLEVGQEACLFLTKHPDEPFYTIPAYYDIINKKDNPNFDKEMESIKKGAKLLSDPKAGLDSKSADDRYLTAALLLTRYLAVRPSPMPPKTEPIAAEESKKILQALADADWTKNEPMMWQMNPQAMFNRLQHKSGWTQPQNVKEIPEAAKRWLRANAESYRIQRNVYDKP